MDVRSVGLSLWPKPPTYQCKTQAILNVFVLIFLNTLNYLKRQVTKKHIETWKSLFWDMQCMKTTAYVYNIALNIPSPTEEELVCSLCWPGRKYRSPRGEAETEGRSDLGQTSASPLPSLPQINHQQRILQWNKAENMWGIFQTLKRSHFTCLIRFESIIEIKHAFYTFMTTKLIFFISWYRHRTFAF